MGTPRPQAGCGRMCTRQEQPGSCEGPSWAAGPSKVVCGLGQGRSGHGKDELRETIGGLVGRICKLKREFGAFVRAGSQTGKRKGQRPRGTGGAGEPAYRKPPDDGQVTNELDVPAKGGCPH